VMSTVQSVSATRSTTANTSTSAEDEPTTPRMLAGRTRGSGASGRKLAGVLSYTGSARGSATAPTAPGSSALGTEEGGLSELSLSGSSAAKKPGGTDGRGGIELGIWYTVQSLPSDVA